MPLEMFRRLFHPLGMKSCPSIRQSGSGVQVAQLTTRQEGMVRLHRPAPIQLQLALCQSDGMETAQALCMTIVVEEGKLPEWVPLLPAGVDVVGRDGRRWKNPNPQAIVEFQQTDARDIPLDWEHSTELQAPDGKPAPAAGWLSPLVVREDGSVWGRCAWTPGGVLSMNGREYRYVSPVILFNSKTREIAGIKSVALTNSPNFKLPALNRAGSNNQNTEEHLMTREQLIALLGLAKTATDEEITTAMNRQKAAVDEATTTVTTLTAERDAATTKVTELTEELTTAKATNSAGVPSLDKYVPRADYELALNRAKEAETKIADQDKATKDIEIETLIADASKAGKITPATVDYHKAQCSQEGGIELFKKFVEAAPIVAAPSGLDGKTPPAAGATLTPDQLAICSAMGLTEEEYRKAM